MTDPILVVTTLQENGTILVANYVVLEARDYEFEGNEEEKTNELIGTFCTKITIDFSSTIVPEQEFINFSFPASADAEFFLQASSIGVWFCSFETKTYTLELRSPTTGTVENDISNDAFAFDPSTLKLTVSRSNMYFDGDSAPYTGNVEFSLCIDSGATCSPNFTLAYTNTATECLADVLLINP